jgi:signal transduction histidine kinase
MIEVLAHELYPATSGGLKTIAAARASRNPDSTGTSLRVLEAQLKTLQKRLKVLDPLSTNARQTKEEFDLVDWVRDIVDSYASQNGRDRIVFRTTVVPRGSTRRIRAVKGMFVQIIENLLSNSVHWILQQDKYDNGPRGNRATPDSIGTITVRIETEAGRIQQGLPMRKPFSRFELVLREIGLERLGFLLGVRDIPCGVSLRRDQQRSTYV